MPKVFTSKSQKLGKLAEDAVASYLVNKGFTIIEQNYTRKWGEIDILALREPFNNVPRETHQTREKITHFIEVKAVSRDTSSDVHSNNTDRYIRPEENMHFQKVKRLKTTIEAYLMSVRTDKRHQTECKRHHEEIFPWQFDLIIVYVDNDNKKMIIKPYWNIII